MSSQESELPGHQKTHALLRHAEDELWVSFERARTFAQRGDIGDTREDALHRFLRSQLPGRFHVGSGEVMDASGAMSGQTDLFIYDGANTRPPFESGSNSLLPAEALLATVEIKSTLTKAETANALAGLAKLRALRPWDAPWEVARRGGRAAEQGVPRIFTTLFAYRTDFGAESWAAKETARVRDGCADAPVEVQFLDRVVVLDRGLLIPAKGEVAEPPQERGVLGLWFIQLVNFLAREVARRDAFPWDQYAIKSGNNWSKVSPALPDLPAVTRATATHKLKARRRRDRRTIGDSDA